MRKTVTLLCILLGFILPCKAEGAILPCTNLHELVEQVTQTDSEIPSFSFLYNGFDINVDEAVFDGTTLMLSQGSISCVDSVVVFKNLSVNESDGLIFDSQQSSYCCCSFDGWNAVFSSLSFEQGKMVGTAVVAYTAEDNSYYWNLLFDNFEIHNDGSISSGTISEKYEENVFYADRFQFQMIDGLFCKVEDENGISVYHLISDRAYIILPYWEEERIEFKGVSATPTGHITAQTNTEAASFETSDGYIVHPETISFFNHQLKITGKVLPWIWYEWYPDSPGIDLPDEGIALTHYYTIRDAVFDGTVQYTYADWNITGETVHFDGYTFSIEHNYVTFNEKIIDVGKLVFTTEGKLIRPGLQFQDVDIGIMADSSIAYESSFSDDGLYIGLKIKYPKVFGDELLYFKRVKLNPDNTFFVESYKEHWRVYNHNNSWDFNSISLSDKGICISCCDITVSLDGCKPFTITFRDVNIARDGSVTVTGTTGFPFEINNMVFMANRISFREGTDDAVLDFDGCVILPSSLPGVLSSRKVELDEFSLNLSQGKIESLKCTLDGYYNIPFMGNLTLDVTTVGIDYNTSNCIVFDGVSLTVPYGYGINYLPVTDVCFDPVKGVFELEKIRGNFTDISTEISNIRFQFDSLQFKKMEEPSVSAPSYVVSLGGSALFADDKGFPTFVEGKRFEVTSFEIKPDGTLGAIDGVFDGYSAHIESSYVDEIHVSLDELRIELHNQSSID